MAQNGIKFGLFTLFGMGLMGCQKAAANTGLILQPIKIEYGNITHAEDILCAPKLFKPVHEPGLAGREIRGEKKGMAPLPQWLTFESDKGHILVKAVCDGQYFNANEPLRYDQADINGNKMSRLTEAFWVDQLENPRRIMDLSDKGLRQKETKNLKVTYGEPYDYSGSRDNFMNKAAEAAQNLDRVIWLQLRASSGDRIPENIFQVGRPLPGKDGTGPYNLTAIRINCAEPLLDKAEGFEDILKPDYDYHIFGRALIEGSAVFNGCSYEGTEKVRSHYNKRNLTVIDQTGQQSYFKLRQKIISDTRIFRHEPEDELYNGMINAGVRK